MESNHGNIPSVIFDWLDKHSFSSLNPMQQAEVRQHFSAEEYDELHFTLNGLKKIRRPVSSSGRESMKQKLLERFDEKHKKEQKGLRILSRPVALWKAASIFLALGCSWFLHYTIMQGKETATQPSVTADTVYITREIPAEPVKVFDTIYMEQIVSVPVRQNKKPGRTTVPPALRESAGSPGDINVLSIKELESLPNKQRGNSIKHDTLMSKFSFTRVL